MAMAIPVVASMAVPAVSGALATSVFGMAAATVVTDVIAGALIGGLAAAVTGGDIMSGVLFGGLGAGLGAAVGAIGGGEGIGGLFGMGGEATGAAIPEAVSQSMGQTGLGLGADVAAGEVVGATGASLGAATGKGTSAAMGQSLKSSAELASGAGKAVTGADFLTGGAGAAGEAAAAPGFLERALGSESVMGLLKGGGEYLSAEAAAKEAAEQERQTAREEREAKYDVGDREDNPILGDKIGQVINSRPGVDKILNNYMRRKPYGSVGTSQPLYKTEGYHAGAV